MMSTGAGAVSGNARTGSTVLDNGVLMGLLQTDALIIGQSLEVPEVFGGIYDRHVSEVHGYLSRRAGGDSADGLVGEVFRVAFENRSRYRTDRDCALPWLYGIAGNILRQHRRSEHRRGRLVARLIAAPLTVTDGEADALRARGELAAVVAALDLLPDAEREAVLLYAWEDLSYEEIATAQGVPVGTVRSRLNRARTRIRELIGEGGQEGDEPIRPTSGRCET